MSILIGGDLVPTESNMKFFMDAKIDHLFEQDLCELLQNVDYRIFNMEVPLTDEINPISKNGPCLIAPAQCIEGYKSINVDLVTLANNHILDQGFKGLYSTMKLCKKHGISFVGAGENIEKARKPFIFTNNSKKIGVYACAEHEYSIATNKSPGANPVDLLEISDHIVDLKRQCDYVIVLYHGGKEHFRYPSPELQKTCRKLIEKGADLVICQHSHCIGCEEKYLQGTIVYGQGNFLFDRNDNVYWQTSLLIHITDDFRVEYIPLKKNKNSVCIAKIEEAKNILKQFEQRSQELNDPEKIIQHYDRLAEQYKNFYILNVLNIKRKLLYRIINKLTRGQLEKHIINDVCNSVYKYTLKNYVECEAHRELLLHILR